MEAGRFDHLIRAATDPGTRRGAVGLLLGSVAGFAGFSANAGKKNKRNRKKKKRKGCRGGCPASAICQNKVCVFCARGQLACGNTCVASTDRANCGACGNACPAGAICQSGACVFCASDRAQCGNTCVNLANDPAHCGRCGKTCPSGECFEGACGCSPEFPCPAGCHCQSSARSAGLCAGAFTGNTCPNPTYQCPLGQVCSAGPLNYCYAACPD